jgi:hypothetical protein
MGMPDKYYLVVDGAKQGPYSREELEAQGLRRETLVWYKGLRDWVPAGRVPELLGVFDEPPPVPGAAPAAPAPPVAPPGISRSEQIHVPSVEPEPGPSSEQIKDPAVSIGPAKMGRADRAEIGPPEIARRVYADEFDDGRDLPPPIAPVRIPYDVVGMRRLYLAATIAFLPGVVLILAVGVAIAFFGIHGVDAHTPRFDPQRKEIVNDFDGGLRSLETLAAVATVAAAILGIAGLAVGATCYFVLLYRAWAVIQDGRISPTPGRAVGLLFVPFFNVYWVFIGVFGLTRALNRFVRRYDLEAPSASQPLGLSVSLYSVLTYIPFPFAGLVPLGLNLVLLPLFMRSIYRTVAAICEDANRERIVHAPLERILRQPVLTRPVSAHILSIAATILPLIGVPLFVIGFGTDLDALRHFNRDARRNEANRQAVDHFRGLGGLNQQDQNRLRDFENQVNNTDRMMMRWRQDLIISSAVLGGGVLILAIAIALAALSHVCARGSEEATPQPPSLWPAAHGAGFLPKNARSPSRHSSVSRGEALP